MSNFAAVLPLFGGLLFFSSVRGQFPLGGLPQQPFPFERTPNQLSPQQQGQILSDIQQHQHRFNLHNANPSIQPQHFSRHQQILSQSGLFNQLPLQQQQNPQQFLQQQFQQQPNNFLRPTGQAQISSLNPTLQTFPSPEPQKNSVVFPSEAPRSFPQNIQPTFQSNFVSNNQIQSSFNPNGPNLRPQPNSLPQTLGRNQFPPPKPTTDPIEAIEAQIRQLDAEKHKDKIKELRDKQAIIKKHNEFVEKQYKKALEKAKAEHEEFVREQKEQRKKLYEKLYKTGSAGEDLNRYTQLNPRVPYPEEVPLFQQALKQYFLEHPTTTTTTTTTTTPTPKTTTKKTVSKKINNKPSFLPTALPSSASTKIQSLEDLNKLKKQYKSQQINKEDLLSQLKAALSAENEDNGKNLASREISLANGKKIQLINAEDTKYIPTGKEEEITLPNGDKVIAIKADKNFITRYPKPAERGDEITLPNGQTVKVFKTLKDAKSSSDLSGEEITLPNGEKAEIIKTSSTSAVPQYKAQEITLPNGQKVEVIKTTDPKSVPGGVPLEPGSDLEKLVLSKASSATVKPPKEVLQELTKNVGSDFEILKPGSSGLEKIAAPNSLPNQKKVTFVLLEEQSDGTLKVQGIKGNGKDKPNIDVDSIIKKIKAGEIKLPSTTIQPPTTKDISTPKPNNKPISVTVTPNSFASLEDFSSPTTRKPHDFSTQNDAESIPILKTNIVTQFVSSPLISSTTPTTFSTSGEFNKVTRSFPDQSKQASSVTAQNQNSIFSASNEPKPTVTTFATSPVTANSIIDNDFKPEFVKSLKSHELTDVLKKNGLYAMAKFLKQSGLDTILNETGPYTLFVPTDKAFRTLLVQLGGPERAEEKFRENPRLLSGLLLHHVIPGSFSISSLQDEMTGVSLAGTQLRVNQYNMHDQEWNDIKVTTINGAKVLDDKQDINIPQGTAHAIDRVMFPLPVGDLVQTLQADRERRFTTILRAIYASGLAEMLQGPKTLTFFAPTDKAFAGLTPHDLGQMVGDKALARELVLRHLMPAALYTNGMRYYQVKDSLQNEAQIVISKHSGKIKINNQSIVTQNIPATNGVIHAVDALL